MKTAQTKSRHRVRMTAFDVSGGHGSRTRNRFPGTTFPVSPLAIRLPSEMASISSLLRECRADKPRALAARSAAQLTTGASSIGRRPRTAGHRPATRYA